MLLKLDHRKSENRAPTNAKTLFLPFPGGPREHRNGNQTADPFFAAFLISAFDFFPILTLIVYFFDLSFC